MHLCESLLSGAPHAYFGVPLGAPCTPVEELFSNTQNALSKLRFCTHSVKAETISQKLAKLMHCIMITYSF